MVRSGRPTTRQVISRPRATRSHSAERTSRWSDESLIHVASPLLFDSRDSYDVGSVFIEPDSIHETSCSPIAAPSADPFVWTHPELSQCSSKIHIDRENDNSQKYCGAAAAAVDIVAGVDGWSSDSSDSTDGSDSPSKIYRPLYRPPERSRLATYTVPGSRKGLAHDRYKLSVALPGTHLEFWDLEKRYRNILIGITITLKATQACAFVAPPRELFLHVYTERLGNRFLVSEAKHSFDQVYHRVVQCSDIFPQEIIEGRGDIEVVHDWKRQRIGSVPLECMKMVMQVDLPWHVFMKNDTKKLKFEVQTAMAGYAFSDSVEMTICNLASESHGLQVRDGSRFIW